MAAHKQTTNVTPKRQGVANQQSDTKLGRPLFKDSLTFAVARLLLLSLFARLPSVT